MKSLSFAAMVVVEISWSNLCGDDLSRIGAECEEMDRAVAYVNPSCSDALFCGIDETCSRSRGGTYLYCVMSCSGTMLEIRMWLTLIFKHELSVVLF